MTWEEAVKSLIDDPTQSELVQACFYDSPVVKAAKRYANSEEWRAVEELLFEIGGGARVLDIGAGRGISSFAFAESGRSVTALEPDSSGLVGSGAIRQLNEYLETPIEIVEDWGESLPFAEETFDLVYGRAVFHHANDINAFCTEAFRVLRPGGRLLLTREHVISRSEDLYTFLDHHPLHRHYGGECAYQLSEYEGAILAAGFVMEKVIGPRESVVNYFPTTELEMKQLASQRLTKRAGRFAGILASIFPSKLNHELRRWDAEDDTPGRLYSFFARK